MRTNGAGRKLTNLPLDIHVSHSVNINNNSYYAVSIQPAPARNFRPLESRRRHFPNPNPNLQNTAKKL